jgi:hypothetical protein
MVGIGYIINNHKTKDQNKNKKKIEGSFLEHESS